MNVGRTDRLVRIILGVVFVALGMFVASGWLGIAFDIAGAVVWLTGMIGYSVIYRLLGGLSTAERPR